MDLFPFIVFYKPDYITNILSLVDVTSNFIVTMDTNNEPATFFHTGPNPVLFFTSDAKDCTILILLPSMYLILPLMLTIYLVPSNKTIFFHRDKIKGVCAARILQCAIGFPSSTKSKSIVKGN